jgi:hypothetical protein
MWFSTSNQPTGENPLLRTHFPQFNQLPYEIRIKIWEFALEPRIIPLHLHALDVSYKYEVQAWDGYAPNDPDESSYSPEEVSRLPVYRPLTEEEGGLIPGRIDDMEPSPKHMAVTPCSGAFHCKCDSPPPHSPSAPSLPAVLFACHESRNTNVFSYKRVMEDEYDDRGLPFIPPTSGLVKSPISKPPVTGVIINPAIDTILISVNVASRTSVVELRHLAHIIARQVPDITKVVLKGRIVMIPLKFYSAQRFQFWKGWGHNGWWVPVISLLKLPRLREVVFYYDEETKNKQFLPDEWKARTQAQWTSELMKVEERWPDAWNGKIPAFNFTSDLKELGGASGG